MQFPNRPPTRQVPGVGGQFPLPTGQVFGPPAAETRPGIGLPRLTDFEKAQLEAMGWKPGMPLPVPTDVQRQAAQVAQEAVRPLPVDPATVKPFVQPPESAMPPGFMQQMWEWIQSVQGGHPPTVPPPPEAPKDGPKAGRQSGEYDTTDAIDYMRAVLGGQPFAREYALFGGRLTVTFAIPTVDDEATALREPTPEAVELSLMRKSLKSIRTEKGTSHPDGHAWMGPTAGLYLSAFRAFRKLYTSLADKADDPNFWTATAR